MTNCLHRRFIFKRTLLKVQHQKLYNKNAVVIMFSHKKYLVLHKKQRTYVMSTYECDIFMQFSPSMAQDIYETRLRRRFPRNLIAQQNLFEGFAERGLKTAELQPAGNDIKIYCQHLFRFEQTTCVIIISPSPTLVF